MVEQSEVVMKWLQSRANEHAELWEVRLNILNVKPTSGTMVFIEKRKLKMSVNSSKQVLLFWEFYQAYELIK